MFEYITDQTESFEKKPFTPADAVILSTIANISLSSYYKKKKKKYVPLGDLASDFVKKPDRTGASQERKLLELIANSPRYKDILVSDVIDDVVPEEEKQFGAMVFHPEKDLSYVGYTGTGTSVIGYKEDLNMAFMDIIPSQIAAVEYINSLNDTLRDRVIVGGYSKGGNLAVFASAFAKPEVRKKINKVYNHDGPGFTNLILEEKKYQTLKPLIETCIPSASIVGIILNHDNDFKAIDSIALPIAQHQPYSWLFEGDDLKIKKDISMPSRFLIKMQKHILDKMSPEERKETVNAIFDIIMTVEPEDFMNLLEEKRHFRKEFRAAWKNLDKEEKKTIQKFIRMMGYALYKSVKPPKKKHK